MSLTLKMNQTVRELSAVKGALKQNEKNKSLNFCFCQKLVK